MKCHKDSYLVSLWTLIVAITTLFFTAWGFLKDIKNSNDLKITSRPVLEIRNFDVYKLSKNGSIPITYTNEILELPEYDDYYYIDCDTEEMKRAQSNKKKIHRFPYYIDFDFANIGNTIANNINFYILYPDSTDKDNFDYCSGEWYSKKNEHSQSVTDINDFTKLSIGNSDSKKIRVELWSAVSDIPNKITDNVFMIITYNNNVDYYFSFFKLSIEENSEDSENPKFYKKFINYGDKDFKEIMSYEFKRNRNLKNTITMLLNELQFQNKSAIKDILNIN